jgi:uncharacterized protein YraI
MKYLNRMIMAQWSGMLVVALLFTACAPSAEPPVATREPAPTFTPTTEGQPAAVDPAVAAAAATAAAMPPAPAAQEPTAEQSAAAELAGEQPTGEAPAAEQPASEQPTGEAPAAPVEVPTVAPTPTVVQAAQVTINSEMNIRGGPGTNYNVLGGATTGQTFPITGKNNDGSWWQINYNGQAGWVFSQLVTAQNAESVAVATNIPAPPVQPTPAPVAVVNTPVPAAPPAEAPPAETPPADAPPAEVPTAAPAPSTNYEFNKAVLQRCDPNEGVTYINGTVYKNGQPANGYNVAFSYEPDGPIVASITSGPHAGGYEGWNAGFYSHILNSTGVREGNWFVWIVDGNGQRISAIGNVTTHGEAGEGKCQQAIIDFDS